MTHSPGNCIPSINWQGDQGYGLGHGGHGQVTGCHLAEKTPWDIFP